MNLLRSCRRQETQDRLAAALHGLAGQKEIGGRRRRRHQTAPRVRLQTAGREAGPPHRPVQAARRPVQQQDQEPHHLERLVRGSATATKDSEWHTIKQHYT